MGASIDNSVNDGHGPPLFKILGYRFFQLMTLLNSYSSTLHALLTVGFKCVIQQ
jgi:hypothetical protein